MNGKQDALDPLLRANAERETVDGGVLLLRSIPRAGQIAWVGDIDGSTEPRAHDCGIGASRNAKHGLSKRRRLYPSTDLDDAAGDGPTGT